MISFCTGKTLRPLQRRPAKRIRKRFRLPLPLLLYKVQRSRRPRPHRALLSLRGQRIVR